MEKNKKKKKLKLIKSLVLVCAFVIAIGATFGVTMAYFGGSSTPSTGTMTLKTGVWVNGTDISSSFTKNVVPSEVVKKDVDVYVKSAATSGADAGSGATAVDALLRASIVLEKGEGATFEIPQANKLPEKFTVTVTKADNSTETAYLVLDTTDNYYYLMTGETLTGNMYEILSSAGEVKLSYNLSVQIPTGLGNSASGQTLKVTISYDVIQSDYYNTAGTELGKDVTTAKTIFTAVEAQDDNNANYIK